MRRISFRTHSPPSLKRDGGAATEIPLRSIPSPMSLTLRLSSSLSDNRCDGATSLSHRRDGDGGIISVSDQAFKSSSQMILSLSLSHSLFQLHFSASTRSSSLALVSILSRFSDSDSNRPNRFSRLIFMYAQIRITAPGGSSLEARETLSNKSPIILQQFRIQTNLSLGALYLLIFCNFSVQATMMFHSVMLA